MISVKTVLAASAVIFLLPSVAVADTAGTFHAASAPAAAASEDEKLAALFHDSDEAEMRRNPLSAISRGDLRYADRFGDYVSDEFYAAEKAAAESDLAALSRIDRSKLSPTSKIAYDVFKYQAEDSLKNLAPEILALTIVRPVDHFGSFQTFYPAFASGEGAAPFKTVEDYENNLKRHKGYALFFDRAIGRFREGLASGVVDTKMTIANTIDQLNFQLSEKPEVSPFFAPILRFPESFSEADKSRLRAAYIASIQNDIYPSYTRLRDFLQKEYLPRARDGVGLVYMKGGTLLYDRLVESKTTLPLKAGEVHDLGLSEVARIRGEMDKIRKQVGFKGTLGQFFEHLRVDPQFQPASGEWLRDRYYEIGKKVDQRVGELFSVLPKSSLEIRAVEAFREKTAAGGSYERGAVDGSRPGIFYFNTYDLPSRPTKGMETLYLHEGVPGHHFQVGLAQENEALPSFMRFGFVTAFGEGWALYAETLGPELGLFTDPYQLFGHYDDEMLRAMRLVVDTGIHAKGWTREQAIQYMLDNSSMSATDATAEVERYIANAGQALAYKVGSLTIQRLKAKAQAALGDRFDVREFHAQVLMTGALPLAVLERKIDDWIESRKK